MSILEQMSSYDYEKLIFLQDKELGLKAIISIHDTTLGPALGGTRMYDYKSEDEAIKDVLRLSRGMTYKAAAVDLELGGGKAVIIADPRKKTEKLWRAYARGIDKLGGYYITAEDVNTTVDDMEIISQETDYVVGLKEKSGDPSPATAYGTFMGMKAACKDLWGSKSLKNKIIAVQGLGNVGYYLCKHLYENGAKLIVADVNHDKVERVKKDFFADSVSEDKIFEVEADIFAPCAMGAVLNSNTIPKLKVDLIAGAANNQLEDESFHSELLKDMNIMYIPDFVINAGGLINVSEELKGYDYKRVKEKTEKIYDNILELLNISRRENISTNEAAYKLANKRLVNNKKSYITL
ncbi:Leu/Phe/Val dehydrogenase [Natranaerofaba carboxydovora]|uniref:Leu/Phe/Val dehydrogenase n=1 Tax=Natranaerofaba carboxydovora TaxID=2742683 RepID=UPI001F147E3C|nr:Glu/Leu/Phe/Val dehydrogenase [Natranaerofaba carboxydovora]UMZ73935.1 Leucine dehydrogenase [Natranaerofaba carboxydovora]